MEDGRLKGYQQHSRDHGVARSMRGNSNENKYARMSREKKLIDAQLPVASRLRLHKRYETPFQQPVHAASV
jgi:hypothetical protein